MRICPTCKTSPSYDQDHGGYCLECNRAYGRANYRKNKERYYKSAKKRDRELDALINEYKNKPCADCHLFYPPYVMDLDHVDPSNKVENISHMRRKRWAFDKIKAELEKCEPVCANCHRERTNQQQPARYSKD